MSDRGDTQVVNVRNNGTLAGLPDDAVIEVPAVVGAGGASPVALRAAGPVVLRSGAARVRVRGARAGRCPARWSRAGLPRAAGASADRPARHGRAAHRPAARGQRRLPAVGTVSDGRGPGRRRRRHQDRRAAGRRRVAGLLAHVRGAGTNPQMIGTDTAMAACRAGRGGRRTVWARPDGRADRRARRGLPRRRRPAGGGRAHRPPRCGRPAGHPRTWSTTTSSPCCARARAIPDAVAVICGTGINCVGRRRGRCHVALPGAGPDHGRLGRRRPPRRDGAVVGGAQRGRRGHPRSSLNGLSRSTSACRRVAAVGEAAALRPNGRAPADRAVPRSSSPRRRRRLALPARWSTGSRTRLPYWQRFPFVDSTCCEAKADVVLGGGILRAGHTGLLD